MDKGFKQKKPPTSYNHICKPHKPRYRPKLAKEFPPSNADKIELKKFSSPSK